MRVRYGQSLPKKAGDTIPCPRCSGAGYTLEGIGREVPVECRRCGGRGTVMIVKSR